jgi:hypothetical protein
MPLSYRIDTLDVGFADGNGGAARLQRVDADAGFDVLKKLYVEFVKDRTGYLHRARALWLNNALSRSDATGPAHIAVAYDGSTATGRVTNSSTAPSVLIAPSVAGLNAANITLAPFVGDTARLNFSFMNRGIITASENDTGISTTGMQLGETGATTLTTALTNGFYNRGSIVASAQSDNQVSTNATAVPTNATGLVIGNGANVSTFGTTATSGYSFIATAITGSTTTELTLGADASNIASRQPFTSPASELGQTRWLDVPSRLELGCLMKCVGRKCAWVRKKQACISPIFDKRFGRPRLTLRRASCYKPRHEVR